MMDMLWIVIVVAVLVGVWAAWGPKAMLGVIAMPVLLLAGYLTWMEIDVQSKTTLVTAKSCLAEEAKSEWVSADCYKYGYLH